MEWNGMEWMDRKECQTVLAEHSDLIRSLLHAGHLYTAGGDVKLHLEVLARQVIRLNFGGDVGPHVAKPHVRRYARVKRGRPTCFTEASALGIGRAT